MHWQNVTYTDYYQQIEGPYRKSLYIYTAYCDRLTSMENSSLYLLGYGAQNQDINLQRLKNLKCVTRVKICFSCVGEESSDRILKENLS